MAEVTDEELFDEATRSEPFDAAHPDKCLCCCHREGALHFAPCCFHCDKCGISVIASIWISEEHACQKTPDPLPQS